MKSKSTSKAPQASGARGIKIYWERSYSHHTNQFIKWYQDNPTKHVKLFSDSTQDAREEGCTRMLLNAAKKNTYFKLAKYIFEHDTELSAEWLAKP